MSLTVEGVNLDALNYTIKVPYNGTIPTGGDSLNADLNVFYDVGLLSLLSPAELSTKDPSYFRLHYRNRSLYITCRNSCYRGQDADHELQLGR